MAISDLYKKYLYDRKAEKLSLFKYLRVISCKDKIWLLKKPGFIKKKLVEIRKNLLILKVKSLWKAQKLSASKFLSKIRRFKKLLKKKSKKRSLCEHALLNKHQFTYSLINLPIVYNENILLGSGEKFPRKNKKNMINIKSRKQTFNKTLQNSETSYKIRCKTPVLASNTPTVTESTESRGHLLPSKFPKLKTLNYKRMEPEKITFFSPVAESLGYRSFNLRIWKPISENLRARISATPNSQKKSSITSIPKSQKILKRIKLAN